jgi:farnesyl-diphosphate farnesyltransferase
MHLSLAVLPPAVREEMGLAYLLCRAADTIADTRLVARKERLKALERYRESFTASPSGPWAPLELARRQAHPAEKALLERLEDAIQAWRGLRPDGREAVKDVVEGVIEGMRMDLTLFPGESADELRAFDFAAQLDRYCAHIGGAPGLFWTRLCRLRVPGLSGPEFEGLEEWGFRLGKGLQMTNILRDVAQDLRIGRCYFPAEDLRPAGVQPRDLLEPGSIERFRPVVLKWTGWASSELEAGEAYVRTMPTWRLRAAVAWPLLLAFKTLLLVERSPRLLEPGRKVKVGRTQVYSILAGSPWMLSSGERFSRQCGKLRSELARDLAAA